MHHVRSLIFIFAFSFVAGSAFAGLAVSPGTPAHTHTDANTGGSTLDVGSFRITSADSRTIFIESDATTDNKRWDWQANAESFLLRTVDDAGAVAGTAVKVDRTGTVVDEISLSATNTSVTGTLSVTGGLTAGSLTTTGSASTGALSASTIAASGTVSSTKGCASGFTRQGPNYCRRFGSSLVAWADAAGCTARTTGLTLPADAKVVRLMLWFEAKSNNAIGQRRNVVSFWDSATCAAAQFTGELIYGAREAAAVAAGTVIGETSMVFDAVLTATDTFYTTQLNAGGNGNADVNGHEVVGYFD